MFKLIISLKCCMMFYLRMKILWMEGIENFPNIDFFLSRSGNKNVTKLV